MESPAPGHYEFNASSAAAGERLDRWLSEQVEHFSRSRCKDLAKEGMVLVNGEVRKPNYPIKADDVVQLTIPEPETLDLIPEDLPLDIIYQDQDIILLNKEAGQVVHPAVGNYSGTVVNALLFHCKDLQDIGGKLRPGIVHRIDKDTSGLLIVAKNEPALKALQAQFKDRTVKKEYTALIQGHPFPSNGTIETQIGRSRTDRKKMSSDVDNGKHAISHFEVIEKYAGQSLVRVRIETGRTHQIRVHMAHIGHPLLGDAVYGRPSRDATPTKAQRHMLHASSLSVQHPSSLESLTFTAPLAQDMAELISTLQKT